MSNNDQIQAWFGKKPISRTEVLSWGAKRATKGMRKFGVPVPAGDVAVLRKALADAKLAMSRAAIEERLARAIRLSDRITGAIARASRGRRRVSQVELFVPAAVACTGLRVTASRLIAGPMGHPTSERVRSATQDCTPYHVLPSSMRLRVQ